MFTTKKTIITFFGPPGTGKGTQADILSKKIGVPVLAPGELLRHETETGTAIGQVVEENMANGELVSDEIIEQIIDKRLSKRDANKGFITDGYPRHMQQLRYFEERLKGTLIDPDRIIAIYIDLDNTGIKRRISGRRVCDCGAAYHLTDKKPSKDGICDLCGGKLYQRRDDRPDIVEDRLTGFYRRFKPLLKHFEEKYKVVRIEGEKGIKETEEEIWQKLNQIVKL